MPDLTELSPVAIGSALVIVDAAKAASAEVALSAPLHDCTSACHFYGATAASAEPPATAPSGAHRPQGNERSVCVTDDVEAVEGGRGGGWGDLDGFPETITISRHEHPTSRRGGDRDTARRAYLEAVGPPTGDRSRVHAPGPQAFARGERGAGHAPAPGGQAPRSRGRR